MGLYGKKEWKASQDAVADTGVWISSMAWSVLVDGKPAWHGEG